MGLDIDICTFEGDTLVSLRGHESFLHLLPLTDAPRIRPDYDDLLLTSNDVADALERVEGRLEDAGVTLTPLSELPEERIYEIIEDLPREFFHRAAGQRAVCRVHSRAFRCLSANADVATTGTPAPAPVGPSQADRVRVDQPSIAALSTACLSQWP